MAQEMGFYSVPIPHDSIDCSDTHFELYHAISCSTPPGHLGLSPSLATWKRTPTLLQCVSTRQD